MKNKGIRLMDVLVASIFIFGLLAYAYMVVNGIFFPDFD